jgi:uncharacterized protein (TIGR01777 family)
VLRLGVVLGTGGQLGRLLPIFRLGLGAPLGTGTQWMPWIHLQDVLAIIEHSLADARWRGVINTVAPEPVTNGGFSTALANVLRRPLWPAAPAWPLRLVLGEMSTLLLDGQRVAPTRLTELGYAFRFPDLQHALAHPALRGAKLARESAGMSHA